jgi:nucleotide-binding universal stress UspA family protein
MHRQMAPGSAAGAVCLVPRQGKVTPVARSQMWEVPCAAMRPRPIVAGENGSLASRAALDWGARTAVAQRCMLLVVRVWEPQTIAPYAPAGPRSAERDRSAARTGLMAAVADLASTAPDLRVRAVLATGLPVRVLLGYAQTAELLVLGGGHRPRCRASCAAGAVALACLRMAQCPVVIVPAPCQRPGDSPGMTGLLSAGQAGRERNGR